MNEACNYSHYAHVVNTYPNHVAYLYSSASKKELIHCKIENELETQTLAD